MSKYTVDIIDAEDYIHVTLSGRGTDASKMLDALATVVEYCRERSVRKVLIEDHIRDEWTLLEMEKLAIGAMDIGFENIEVAIYLHKHDRQFIAKFGAGIANSRGANFNIFTHLETAQQSLIKK